MLTLLPDLAGNPLRLLCLGAHSDDIEIGCAGTLLTWLGKYPQVEVTWAVFSATGNRRDEAMESAKHLLDGVHKADIRLFDLRDGFFPAEYERAKGLFEELKSRTDPHIVLSHHLDDRHQDHRIVSEMTWQTFRNHLVLEYEIPKYEGDLGHPQVYVPVSSEIAARKIRHLDRHFGSQRSKSWFRSETFESLLHLRGLECRAPDGTAEAFHLRKAII